MRRDGRFVLPSYHLRMATVRRLESLPQLLIAKGEANAIKGDTGQALQGLIGHIDRQAAKDRMVVLSVLVPFDIFDTEFDAYSSQSRA